MQFVRGVILGAGSSTSTPSLGCVASGIPCASCAEALQNTRSRNHRLNPSFLLQLRHPVDGSIHNVLIDCGKTFRESAIKVFPTFGVRDLSAVLLTHEHADAAFGLDDLRDFNRPDTPVDVFADDHTMSSMRRMYTYLFPKDGPPKVGEWRKKKRTFIASVQWITLASLKRLDINIRSRVSSQESHTEGEENITKAVEAPFYIVPVAVPHGINYYSNAFLIPLHRTHEEPRLLLYVSDVSKVEAKFFEDIARAKALLGVEATTRLEVLILDMLSRTEHSTHLHVDASIEAAKRIDALHTFFIGMSHSLNYDVLTKQLEELGLAERMSIGFDGCVVATGCDTGERPRL